MYYYLGDYQQARDELTTAAGEGNSQAILMMGSLYLETGDVSSARSLFESYLEEEEQPAAAYNGLALCDISQEDYESAMENIQKGIACQDESVMQELLFNEIVVCERQLNFQTAKAKMKEYLERYPEDEEALRENTFLQSR